MQYFFRSEKLTEYKATLLICRNGSIARSNVRIMTCAENEKWRFPGSANSVSHHHHLKHVTHKTDSFCDDCIVSH